jgi:hypothetical protein
MQRVEPEALAWALFIGGTLGGTAYISGITLPIAAVGACSPPASRSSPWTGSATPTGRYA